jgi:hypothetical protein
MATTAELNAVFTALKTDIDSLVSDLVPSFLQGEANQQITVARVLKLVTDGVAAYEQTKAAGK